MKISLNFMQDLSARSHSSERQFRCGEIPLGFSRSIKGPNLIRKMTRALAQVNAWNPWGYRRHDFVVDRIEKRSHFIDM